MEMGVRVRADGTGLVGQLTQDKAAIEGVKGAMDNASASAQKLATATGQVAQAERNATTQTKAHDQAQRQAAGAARAHQTAMVGVGQQLQDMVVGWQSGQRATTIFAQQLPQLAFQLQGVGGITGRLATFMAGPFGAGFLVAGLAIAGATSALGANEGASRNALTASDALAQAQSAVGDMFDLTTGKVKENTEALRLNALMAAANMRAQAAQQRSAGLRTIGNAGEFSWASTARNILGATVGPDGIQGGDQRAATQARSVELIMQRMARGEISRERAVQLLTRIPTDRLNVSGLQLAQAGVDILNADQADQSAAAIERSVATGSLDPSLRRDPRGSGRTRRGRDGTAAAQRLAEFGSDAGTRIFELMDQFRDTPSQVARVNRAIADLDDLLEDVEQRRPPGFEQLLAQGREARQVIEDGINRPFREFIESQEESLAVLRLQARGRTDEAEALRIIQQLEQQTGPLTEARKDAILASVQAIRAEQREMEILRDRQQMYLDALGQTRDIIQGTIRGVLDGDLRAIRDLPGQLRKTFNDLLSRYLTENLFGGAFRELEDRATGNNIAREAAGRFRDAVAEAESATLRFTRSMERAAGAVSSPSAPANLAGADVARGALAGLFGDDVSWAGLAEQPITVTARRSTEAPLDPRRFFEDMITRLGEGIFGRRASEVIGRVVGQGLQGAAYGSIGGGIAGMIFGGKQSQTGSALGGALGNILGEAAGPALGKAIGGTLGQALGSAAGPIGSVVGGIVGSMVIGALTPAKRGSATINSVDGAISTRGNSSQFKQASSGMASSVQDALQQIADQFGGSVGNFAVSLGVRDGKIRVDPSGRGITKTKKGAVDFGEDQAAAISYAIVNAIADGGVTGLSQAIQQALRSSTDINKALREAMKVDELETLLSGSDGALNKAFKDFERQAEDRLRIAQRYGFDLVKLEEVNAKERAKLFDDILSSKVGKLQELLDSMNFGELFEGTVTDQRQKLLLEIAKAEGEASSGTEGAADRVADLRSQLLELTRGGFGTAGPEFAADRASTRATAEEIIRLENERVKAAQEAALATSTGIATNNQLTNENNYQNAEMINLLRSINQQLGGGASVAQALGRNVMTRDAVV